MECPKCHKNVSGDDAVCSNCGVPLKETKKKNFKGFFREKKKEAESGLNSVKQKALGKKAKFIYAIVVALILVLLVVLIVIHFSGEKGNKIASEYAEYIGGNVAYAEKETGINLKGDSAFRCLNSAMSFDEIYECEDDIVVDDISFPKWAVTVNLNDDKKIDNVVYTDFTQIKNDLRGEKKDKLISLEKFDKGTKYNTVFDEIDLEPYSITYEKKTVTYIYKYYYMTDYGDAQSVILSVTFDDDNKYLYSSEDMIYPDNL